MLVCERGCHPFDFAQGRLSQSLLAMSMMPRGWFRVADAVEGWLCQFAEDLGAGECCWRAVD